MIQWDLTINLGNIITIVVGVVCFVLMFQRQQMLVKTLIDEVGDLKYFKGVHHDWLVQIRTHLRFGTHMPERRHHDQRLNSP